MDRKKEGKIVVSAASDAIPMIPKAEKGPESVRLASADEQAAEKKRFRVEALVRRDSLTAGQRQEYSDRLVKKLTSLPCYIEADAILTYISFRSEADTFPLLERAFADGKAVFAPRVQGKEMDFYRIYSREELAEGYRGILEPVGGQLFDEWINDQISQCENQPNQNQMPDMEAGERKTDKGREMAVPSVLICMPGAAFDRARHRIGYGGGFYDRYLSGLLHESDNMDAAAQAQTVMSAEGYSRVKVTTAALAYDCQIFEKIPCEAHDICPMYVVTEKEIFR